MDESEKELYNARRKSMVKWLIEQDYREFMSRNRPLSQKKREELFKQIFGEVYIEMHKGYYK